MTVHGAVPGGHDATAAASSLAAPVDPRPALRSRPALAEPSQHFAYNRPAAGAPPARPAARRPAIGARVDAGGRGGARVPVAPRGEPTAARPRCRTVSRFNIRRVSYVFYYLAAGLLYNTVCSPVRK